MNSPFASQFLQITAAACVVWLVTKKFTRSHSHLNYLLWLIVLLKCLTPPIWSSPVGAFCWLQGICVNRLHVNEPNAALAKVELERFDASSVRVIPIQPQTSIAPSDDDFTELISQTASTNRQLRASAIPTFKPIEIIEQDFAKRPTIALVAQWSVALWLSISLILMLQTLVKLTHFIRRIEKSEVEHAALQQMALSTSEKLSIPWRVRLLVTSESVGPAVVGFIRPLIVVPRQLVDQCSINELEPILAHELLHIRRGDLWIGLLRHFACCLWWFHPLVWKMSGEIRRIGERCCDEEVVSSLEISPTQYARTLLSVLELKQVLKPVPVAPGVRPFDITSDRLEKIMKLGQGSHRRTPNWCWAIAILLAFVILPGANRIHGQVGNARETEVTQKPVKVAEAARLKLPPTPAASAEEPRIAPMGDVAAESAHVLLDCLFVAGPIDAINELSLPWQAMPSSKHKPDDDDATLQGKPKTVWAESSVRIEKKQPTFYALLDQDQIASILGKVDNSTSIQVLSRPKVMTKNGSVGSIQVGAQIPYVVGVDSNGPVTQTYHSGLNANLRPLMLDDGVQLKYQLGSQEILSVEEVELKAKENSAIAVQLPEVKSSVLIGENLIPDGATLLLRMETGDHADTGEALLVVVTPTRVVSFDTNADTNKGALLEFIPWHFLRRTPHEKFVIQPQDVVGVYVAGGLGSEDQLPPVNIPNASDVSSALGYPVTVRSDGTIPLPFIVDPIIAGLTIEEAERKLIDLYSERGGILKKDQTIIFTMIRPKDVRVFVERQDSLGKRLLTNSGRGSSVESTSSTVSIRRFELVIPEREADVLAALANTGGLPGHDIQVVAVVRGHDENRMVRRIPLRVPAGHYPVVRESDVSLQDGDVVIVAADQTDAELTGIADRLLLENRNPISASKGEVTTVSEFSQSSFDSIKRWPLTLNECAQIALQNTHVTRALGVRAAKSVSDPRIKLIRDNPDIAVTEAEINARDFLFEVTQAYWNLLFHYHNLDATRGGAARALATWKSCTLSGSLPESLRSNPDFSPMANDLAAQRSITSIHESIPYPDTSTESQHSIEVDAGEAHARAKYFAFKDKLEHAKTALLHQESRLRYLLGLTSADGRVIHPVDQPRMTNQKVVWHDIKSEALKRSPELRRQRRRIEQMKLQLDAAVKQLSPHVDPEFIQHLLSQEVSKSVTDSISGWKIGQEFSIPIEYRDELNQLRNCRLQLRRTENRLKECELTISHELATAWRRQRDTYRTATTRFNMLRAYQDQVASVKNAYESKRLRPDVVLDAQSRCTQAEVDYYRVLVDYQLAIAEVQYRNGTSLQSYSVQMESDP